MVLCFGVGEREVHPELMPNSMYGQSQQCLRNEEIAKGNSVHRHEHKTTVDVGTVPQQGNGHHSHREMSAERIASQRGFSRAPCWDGRQPVVVPTTEG